MKIDVERIIDALIDESTSYNACIKQSKELYNGTLEDFPKRKEKLRELFGFHDMFQTVNWTIAEVLLLTTEQKERLRIAARAVEKWRKRTDYKHLMPEQMQKQVEEFVWGKESNHGWS